MIWYVCFVLAAAVIAVLLKITVDKKLGKMRMLYVAIGCLVVVYILYIPPLFKSYDFMTAIMGGFINVLQVISLDADYLAFYELIRSELGTTLFSQIYYAVLALTHVVTPAVFAMTAVTVVWQCLAEIQIKIFKKRKKALHVFSDVNYEAIILARDIRAHDKKCDILFLSSKEEYDFHDMRRELRCSVLNEKIENIKALSKNRKVYYYCISEDQEGNLNASLAIMAYLGKTDRVSQQNTYIFIFSADRSAELIIDSIDKGFVNINIIDKLQTAAYKLLQEYPLPRYAVNKEMHVLLCGFTDMNKSVLRAAVWCGQLFGYALDITVLGREIDLAVEDFKAEYPGLFTERYAIEFHSYITETEYRRILEEKIQNATYVVVAETDCDRTVDKSVDLRRHFYKADSAFKNAPPIFAYIENTEKANAVRSLATAESNPARRMRYDIIPFGMATDVYSFENITASDLERIAKNVHLVYEDIFSTGPLDVIDALERYNLFEVNKSSNRANAMHIRYKLLMLGLDYTDDPNAQEVELSAYLSKESLEDLSWAEHSRWMAFLESEGWVSATLEQANAYMTSGISKGRHNCPVLKMHPYICPYAELATRSEKLGLPDSTVYDRELIARIPDILHDKWGASGRRFKIVKADYKEQNT